MDMTRKELVKTLKEELAKEGSITAWVAKRPAPRPGVGYVSSVKQGTAKPGKKVLAALAHSIGAGAIEQPELYRVVGRRPGRPRK